MADPVYLKFEDDAGVLELEGLSDDGRLIIEEVPAPLPTPESLWYPSGMAGVGPGYDLSKVVCWAPDAQDPEFLQVRFYSVYYGHEGADRQVNPTVRFERIAFEQAILGTQPFSTDCHYEMDGLLDYVAFDTDSGLATQPLTLSLWLRTTENDGTLLVAPADPLLPALKIVGGRLWFGHAGNPPIAAEHAATEVDPGGLLDGLWHHVALVHEPDGQISFYVDGSLYPVVDGGPIVSFLGATDAPIWLARGADHAWYTGAVDELSWWITPLDAMQVQLLYNAGAPGDLREHPANLFLLHWWQLGNNDELPLVLDRQLRVNGTAYGLSEASCV